MWTFRIAGRKFHHQWNNDHPPQGTNYILKRAPENQFDPNAIEIHYQPQVIIDPQTVEDEGFPLWLGFVPKAIAATVAPLMDSGQQFICWTLDTQGDMVQLEEQSEEQI